MECNSPWQFAQLKVFLHSSKGRQSGPECRPRLIAHCVMIQAIERFVKQFSVSFRGLVATGLAGIHRAS